MNEKLEEKLNRFQNELELKFEGIREQFEHSGNKGTNGEYIIKDFLKYYFSPQYQFGNGEVIDSKGRQSGQVDIVITNKYHPCISDYNIPSIFFIEGVSCCGEVKFLLTSAELTKSLDNCTKYKELEPKLDGSLTAYSNKEDLKRFVNKRPYFLFCYESQLTIETVNKKISLYNSQKRLEVENQIDSVFLMDKGLIYNLGYGNGSLKYVDADGGLASGFKSISKDTDYRILLNLVRWLNYVIIPFDMKTTILSKYLY